MTDHFRRKRGLATASSLLVALVSCPSWAFIEEGTRSEHRDLSFSTENSTDSKQSVSGQQRKKAQDNLLESFKRGGGRSVGTDGSLPELSTLMGFVYKVRPNETLSVFLSRIGVKNKKERATWLRGAQERGIPLTLKKGELIKVYKKRAASAPILLQFSGTETKLLSPDQFDPILNLAGDRKAKVVIRSIGMEVERSLTEDALRIGLGQQIISKLADIFSWKLNFSSGIEPGDSVKVVYEEIHKSAKNRFKPSVGDILAAEIEASGKKYIAIYFRNGNEGRYYNEKGEALSRPLLRYPLEFNHVSSPFSLSRFHPRLRLTRPHFGVDFVAREGTPVRSIGDGKVVFASWNGSYGRFVKIQHGPVYSSAYAHLKTIRSGIGVGATVRKGEKIGTVGSTGLSTGPHLHFALFKNDRYVDPLAVHAVSHKSIPQQVARQFEKAKNSLLARLEAIVGS